MDELIRKQQNDRIRGNFCYYNLEEKEFPGIIPSSFETINDYCEFFRKLIDYEEYKTLADQSKVIFTCINSFCNGPDANENVLHYLKE
jgi:hypothetical protein